MLLVYAIIVILNTSELIECYISNFSEITESEENTRTKNDPSLEEENEKLQCDELKKLQIAEDKSIELSNVAGKVEIARMEDGKMKEARGNKHSKRKKCPKKEINDTISKSSDDRIESESEAKMMKRKKIKRKKKKVRKKKQFNFKVESPKASEEIHREIIEKHERSIERHQSKRKKEKRDLRDPDMDTSNIWSSNLRYDMRLRRIMEPDQLAKDNEYQFMASVLMSGRFWCAGSIVHQNLILTSAHCLQLIYNNRFYKEVPQLVSVRLGSINATMGGSEMRVEEIFFHPSYSPRTLRMNFALLKLTDNISYNVAVKRIEYEKGNKDVPTNADVLVLGWGSDSDVGGFPGSKSLQVIQLPVYERGSCKDTYGDDNVQMETLCVGALLNKGVCNHDAGGPAVLNSYLVGVSSFGGDYCGNPDRPTVYGKVSAVSQWIINVRLRKVHGFNIRG